MIKVGIIGCGKIADQHATQIRRIPRCQIVAACDREPLMARQMAERFGIPRVYDDVTRMLAEARPDIVHITTPPVEHFALCRQCLEAGIHTYVEKPFTLNLSEAENLIGIADKNSVMLTVGHNVQFSPESRRMRELVDQGYLGGPPMHIESMYCYDLADGNARAFLGDRNHWLRKLPGKLLQNLISHGIAKIVPFIPSDRPKVRAQGFVSPYLRGLGEKEIVDELRVMVNSDNAVTAFFTFSSSIRPLQNQLRLFGPKHSLIVDQDHQVVVKMDGGSYKAQMNYILPPLRQAKEYRQNAFQNLRRFLHRDLHLDTGMKYLIESFYAATEGKCPIPLPYREILLVSRIMEDIFQQVGGQA
jgi:predicted dehydrogenase